MTHVKICGLKRYDDALVAAEAGADLLGFVFAPSRRRVQPEEARDIIAGLRGRTSVGTVGIFVNEDPTEMNRLADLCDLDYLQLSGHEPDDLVDALARPAIQVVHVEDDITAEALQARAASIRAEMILLDTAQQGSYGGTGRAFAWDRIPPLPRPVLLAGGLHSGNVGEAIRVARPWGVDVSSGVETNGEKDQAKIKAFIAEVRKDHGGAGKRGSEREHADVHQHPAERIRGTGRSAS
jgi:phosphoribosylanthranilate isomerase